jgi:translation initiation factor 1
MSKSKNSRGGIVYSTNPDYRAPEQDDNTEQTDLSPAQQDLRIWLERKGGGKLLTVIKGFLGSSDQVDELARKLKGKCGVGGSVKDQDILIQGDHRDKIIRFLEEWGYRSRKAGG